MAQAAILSFRTSTGFLVVSNTRNTAPGCPTGRFMNVSFSATRRPSGENSVTRRNGTVPVLSNGRLYCRGGREGNLVCLDVSK
jgi:hypothetical protein